MEYWASFAVMNLAIMISMYLIQKKQIDLLDYKTYLIYFISTFLLICVYDYASPIYRVFFNTLIYIIESKILFCVTIKESFILGVIITLLNIVSEVIFAVLGFQIISKYLFLESSSLFVFFNNTIIGIVVVCLGYLMKRKNFYLNIINRLPKIKETQIVVFSLFIVIIFNFLGLSLHLMSIETNSPTLFLINSSLSIFTSVLVYTYLKTSNRYKVITEKYDLTMNTVLGYEKIIENNKISNHETRNQFRTIRNMTTNKNLINYINSILNDNINDSEDILIEVSKIPSGGLRGLIYTKLLYMKENNINYELHVDKKVNVSRINKIESNCMVDICKIVGVFLDNAIEAVQKLDEKNITIELYVENKNLIISITNNFAGYIDAENLDKAGYTTKSSGHGYGLRLVKDIISKNERLENDREIYEDNFTQNLKIKM